MCVWSSQFVFRFLTIIIIDIPRVTLPAIDVAGLLGCRRSAVVAAGAPFFLFHETASQKREKNLRKNLKTTSSSSLGREVVSSTASMCFAVVHRIPDE